MICPKCNQKGLQTTNSRSTKSERQTWRRKHCPSCQAIITTYERPDLGWLDIESTHRASVKPYRRFLLTISILEAFDNKNDVRADIEALVDTIESQLLSLGQNPIAASAVIAVVAKSLKPVDLNAYLRYLAAHTHPHNQRELNKLIKTL